MAPWPVRSPPSPPSSPPRCDPSIRFFSAPQQARERPAIVTTGASGSNGRRGGLPPRHRALRDPLLDEDEREEARRLMDASPLEDCSPRTPQGAPDVEDVRRCVDAQVQEIRALSDWEAAERLGAARMFLDALPTPALSPRAALVGGVARDAVEAEVRAAASGLGYDSALASAPSPAERTRPPARLKPLARKATPHGTLRSLRGGDSLDGVTAPGQPGTGLFLQYFGDGGDRGGDVDMRRDA